MAIGLLVMLETNIRILEMVLSCKLSRVSYFSSAWANCFLMY